VHLKLSDCLTEDDLLLDSVCRGCKKLALDLIERLNKLSVPKTDQKGLKILWRSLSVAFLTIWIEQDLLKIRKLSEYRDEIDSQIIASLR
jgi:hypothetical protein